MTAQRTVRIGNQGVREGTVSRAGDPRSDANSGGENLDKVSSQTILERSEPIQQILVLEDFPDPKIARVLSPNGRVHWAARDKARREVAARVAGESIRRDLQPATGPVRLTFRWVFPTRARRDLDNLSTGVVKALIDTLVRHGTLADDDSRHVVSVAAEAAYEKGRRALEVTIAPAPLGSGAAGED